MKRVLITGPREWTNPKPIESELETLIARYRSRNLLVIVGGARGVDTLAEAAAKDRGVHVAHIDALWDSYHRGAGTMRNGVMLSLKPHLVLAFHWDLRASRGTLNCVNQAKAAKRKVRVVLVPKHTATAKRRTRGTK